MQEIELKFLVPQARLKGLMRQAKVKSSEDIQLAAHYYDTPKQALAKAGIGLRIRQEGDDWVQTIKGGGDGIAARLEHNALLDNELVQTMLTNNDLMPDLTIYKDTSIEPLLATFKLNKLAKNLTRQYVTEVQRTTRLLEQPESNGQNRIETAYDYGQVIHGNDASQHQAIQEIEFELLAGDLSYLFATAKLWCKRYSLCLSTVTKAERGSLLIQGQLYSKAVSANLAQLQVDQDSSRPAFVRAAVHNCLLQILPNSSAMVAGSEDDTHSLQLRIGICRLLVVLNSFDKFSEQLNPKWQPILKQAATLLSDYHQLAHLNHIEDQLQQHGAPSIDWTAEVAQIKVTPIDAVRANDFQLTLLELIEFTMSDASAEPQAQKLAIDKLPKILSKKYSKLLKAEQKLAECQHDWVNNDHLETAKAEVKLESDNIAKMLHKTHQSLKDLRYLSEFAAPLYAKKNTKRWLKRLVKAQKSLGQYQEHSYYQQCYQQKVLTDIEALYAAGWFAATLINDRKRCQKRLNNIQNSATFW